MTLSEASSLFNEPRVFSLIRRGAWTMATAKSETAESDGAVEKVSVATAVARCVMGADERLSLQPAWSPQRR